MEESISIQRVKLMGKKFTYLEEYEPAYEIWYLTHLEQRKLRQACATATDHHLNLVGMLYIKLQVHCIFRSPGPKAQGELIV